MFKSNERKIPIGLDVLPIRSSNGVAADPKRLTVSPAETIVVFEQTCALGTPSLKESRYLVTYGLGPCIALLAYNAEKKVGFLAHINAPSVAEEALTALTSFNMKELVVYGGNESSMLALRAIADALRYLKVNVTGVNTLTENVFNGRKIGIDTETGEIFIPENLIYNRPTTPVPPLSGTSLAEILTRKISYDSPIPASTFMDIVRET